MSEVVHQIRYGWSPSSLLGTSGMGPVESTLPAERLTVWDRFLRDHVWAASAEPGFTFIVHGRHRCPAQEGRDARRPTGVQGQPPMCCSVGR